MFSNPQVWLQLHFNLKCVSMLIDCLIGYNSLGQIFCIYNVEFWEQGGFNIDHLLVVWNTINQEEYFMVDREVIISTLLLHLTFWRPRSYLLEVLVALLVPSFINYKVTLHLLRTFQSFCVIAFISYFELTYIHTRTFRRFESFVQVITLTTHVSMFFVIDFSC